jgi:hypothetical protein
MLWSSILLPTCISNKLESRRLPVTQSELDTSTRLHRCSLCSRSAVIAFVFLFELAVVEQAKQRVDLLGILSSTPETKEKCSTIQRGSIDARILYTREDGILCRTPLCRFQTQAIDLLLSVSKRREGQRLTSFKHSIYRRSKLLQNLTPGSIFNLK